MHRSCRLHFPLLQVPAWRELLQAFAAAPLPGAFAGLHSRLHCPLAAAVCSHVAGFRALDRPGKLDMLQHLLQSTLSEVGRYAPGPAAGEGRAAAADAANVRSRRPFPALCSPDLPVRRAQPWQQSDPIRSCCCWRASGRC